MTNVYRVTYLYWERHHEDGWHEEDDIQAPTIEHALKSAKKRPVHDHPADWCHPARRVIISVRLRAEPVN